MANEKISASPSADLPLDGTELVPLVQDGDNKHCTAQDIADLGGGGGGAVSSVFGRTGAVVPVANDYDASEIQNTPSGGIAATNVQAALNELDSEKASTAYADGKVAQTITNGITTSAPSQDAVFDGLATNLLSAQSYADGLVVGLWDDRGSFSAAGGAYPSTGGSGSAGAIKKGDIWTISVAGTLPTGQVVEVGDTVRALIDTPGNTQANWAIQQNNIGYVPVNKAGDTMTGNLAFGGTLKNTGLAAGSAAGDSVRYEQVITDYGTPLTDGATVTWTIPSSVQSPLAILNTTRTSFTLAFSGGGPKSGATGIWKIVINQTAALVVTFPTAGGIVNQMQNVTFTTYTFPAGASGRAYFLYFTVEGLNIEWTTNVPTQPILTAGTAVRFDVPRHYGFGGYGSGFTPETGNITLDTTNFIPGVAQFMLHNSSSTPSFASQFLVISGTYTINENNAIAFYAIDSTKIYVTINVEP